MRWRELQQSRREATTLMEKTVLMLVQQWNRILLHEIDSRCFQMRRTWGRVRAGGPDKDSPLGWCNNLQPDTTGSISRLHFCYQLIEFPLSVPLPASLSLTLFPCSPAALWLASWLLLHAATAIRVPAGGGAETATACCESPPKFQHRFSAAAAAGSFCRPPCVRGSQHFLPHAWRGETNRPCGYELLCDLHACVKCPVWKLDRGTECNSVFTLTGWQTRFIWRWIEQRVFDRASRPLILHSAKDIKHKISFLLQKPEAQAAEQKPAREKTAAPSAAVRRSEEALRLVQSLSCCVFSVTLCVPSIHPTVLIPTFLSSVSLRSATVSPSCPTTALYVCVTFNLGVFERTVKKLLLFRSLTGTKPDNIAVFHTALLFSRRNLLPWKLSAL